MSLFKRTRVVEADARSMTYRDLQMAFADSPINSERERILELELDRRNKEENDWNAIYGAVAGYR